MIKGVNTYEGKRKTKVFYFLGENLLGCGNLVWFENEAALKE